MWGLSAGTQTEKEAGACVVTADLAMASQRVFTLLFLLRYVSETIPTKVKSRSKRKGQTDPEVSPFLNSVIPGAPAGHTQPDTQIAARRRRMGLWEGRTAPLLSLGKAGLPGSVPQRFPPPRASTPPAGGDPTVPPPSLLPALSARLPVVIWVTQGPNPDSTLPLKPSQRPRRRSADVTGKRRAGDAGSEKAASLWKPPA